jgi:hypothetical protein
MKFPSFCVVASVGSLIACGGEDPATSTQYVGMVGVAPGLDAGVAVPGSATPGTGAQPGTGQPSTPGTGSPTTDPGSNNNGNGGVCEVRSVDSGRVPPDMLIVLDRSGSMKNGGVNRWDPSVSALKMITSSFGSSVSFGLLAFPGTAMNAPPPMPTQDCSTITDIVAQIACIATEAAGGVATVDTCVAGSVEVPIGLNNGMAIASALDRMAPEGATPTAVSLKAAHDAIGSGMAALDDTVKAKYVLLVTDGAPNCSSAASTGGGRGGRGFDQQAVDQSVAEIAAMAKDGVKTFVIGYNTKSDAQLSAALDRMAQAGGTGDTQHHAIEDGNSLLAEFQKIAGAAASCELVLNTAPANPSFVQVKLDDMQINLNDPNGWTISADRRRITLQGSACAAVAGKERHQVSVHVLCEPVVLQ